MLLLVVGFDAWFSLMSILSTVWHSFPQVSHVIIAVSWGKPKLHVYCIFHFSLTEHVVSDRDCHCLVQSNVRLCSWLHLFIVRAFIYTQRGFVMSEWKGTIFIHLLWGHFHTWEFFQDPGPPALGAQCVSWCVKAIVCGNCPLSAPCTKYHDWVEHVRIDI